MSLFRERSFVRLPFNYHLTLTRQKSRKNASVLINLYWQQHFRSKTRDANLKHVPCPICDMLVVAVFTNASASGAAATGAFHCHAINQYSHPFQMIYIYWMDAINISKLINSSFVHSNLYFLHHFPERHLLYTWTEKFRDWQRKHNIFIKIKVFCMFYL